MAKGGKAYTYKSVQEKLKASIFQALLSGPQETNLWHLAFRLEANRSMSGLSTTCQTWSRVPLSKAHSVLLKSFLTGWLDKRSATILSFPAMWVGESQCSCCQPNPKFPKWLHCMQESVSPQGHKVGTGFPYWQISASPCCKRLLLASTSKEAAATRRLRFNSWLPGGSGERCKHQDSLL